MEEHTALRSRAALRTVTDRQLVNILATLTALDRHSLAKLVAGLAEFDERNLCRPLGFNSLFAYCTNRLGFSEDEAFLRIEAARVVRRFPVALTYLESNSVTLSTLRLLRPHLTADNHEALLSAASHQRKPEVEKMIARLKPKPDVPSTIRKLPAISRELSPQAQSSTATSVTTAAAIAESDKPVAGGTDGPDLNASSARPVASTPATAAASSTALAPSAARASETSLPARPASAATPALPPPQVAVGEPRARRPIISPLSETSYRLQITMSQAMHDRLRQIQSMMRHAIPTGDPAVIIDRSLELMLASLTRRRIGSPKGLAPRPTWHDAKSPSGRYLPVHVRRAVWDRDGGACAFVAPDGTRCAKPDFVEFHHVKPYARGGKATVRNIELRCRAHNALESERDFGSKIAGQRRGSKPVENVS